MPLFFQHVIDDTTQLALWKIEEEEAFFSEYVPLQRTITHPHKRLQHLAGRYLLQYLFPDFPVSLIQVADTRKPFLQDEAYHFSISHCGDYAGVIVSKNRRVGIDIELITDKIQRIQHKFVLEEEWKVVNSQESGVRSWELENRSYDTKTDNNVATDQLINQLTSQPINPPTYHSLHLLTLIWSCKEAAFKWYGLGEVDFKGHMELREVHLLENEVQTKMLFKKNEDLLLDLHSRFFDKLVLSYVVT